MKISSKMDAFALKTSLCVALALFFCCQQGNAQNSINAVANAAIAPVGQPQSFQYLFFWKDDDAKTRNLLQMTQQEIEKMGPNVSLAQIAIKDPANAKLVEQYGVSRAPMPLVSCIAANGAVTKAFVAPFTATQLHEGLVSRGSTESLKALQARKLVVLCAFNGSTQANNAVLQSAQQLRTDARFSGAVEIVTVDVNDAAEANLLKQFELTSKMSQPTTIILAPPGNQLAKLVGVITTEQLAEKVIAAQNSCCPGGTCGPNSPCCPGGQCPPQKK